MENVARLPKPEIKGFGHVLYRCAACDELMEPERAVVLSNRSYHPEHTPENVNGR